MKGPDLLKIVDKYDSAVEKQEAATVKLINKRLIEALNNINGDLTSYYERQQQQGSLAAQMQVRRSQELTAILSRIEPEYETYFQGQLDELLRTSNAAGTELASELLSSYGAQSAVGSFTEIPYAALANQVSEGVKRLGNHTAAFRSQASAVIEQGLIQGKGAAWMKRQLKEQVAGITSKKAEDIARTESSSALNAAAEQRYAAAEIKYVQLMITPSQRVCPFCAGRNGAVFELGKMRVPLHVRCRCMILPYDKEWQKAGLIDDAFIIDYHKKGVAELRKNGFEPKYTEQAPFEKSNKLPAPKVVWSPRGKSAETVAPKPTKPTAQPAKKKASKKKAKATVFGTSGHGFPELEKINSYTENYNQRQALIREFYRQKAGITKEEAIERLDAIRDYTGNDYTEIRAFQRGANPKWAKPGDKEKFLRKAQKIEDYIETAVKYDGTIHRGIGLDSLEDFYKRFGAVGDEFTETTMNSWSSEKEVADSFADDSNRLNEFVFTVKKQTRGASIEFISQIDDEKEVLVPSNSKYKVVSIDADTKAKIREGHSRYNVVLEEINE